jgi:hypothetical protein
MARFLDPTSQGKLDWLSYTQRRQESADNAKKDAENNQRIAERKEQKNKDAQK